jgi:hypothetical protein
MFHTSFQPDREVYTISVALIQLLLSSRRCENFAGDAPGDWRRRLVTAGKGRVPFSDGDSGLLGGNFARERCQAVEVPEFRGTQDGHGRDEIAVTGLQKSGVVGTPAHPAAQGLAWIALFRYERRGR